MALTFLTLTNSVITRMNEVELTSSNFASARGVQIQCKNAVNEAIRHINQKEFAYPFNHATNSSTLVPGVVRYSIPTGTKYIDYNTARIKRNTALSSSGINLKKINYNEYIRSWVYMYPIKNDLFYQINFSDIYTDKCDELFSQIINDIK